MVNCQTIINGVLTFRIISWTLSSRWRPNSQCRKPTCCICFTVNTIPGAVFVTEHSEAETKWSAFSRHFQMHFRERKCMNFDKYFTESYSKPFSELMVVSLLTHICVTRPQWVKEPGHEHAWNWPNKPKYSVCSIGRFIWWELPQLSHNNISLNRITNTTHKILFGYNYLTIVASVENGQYGRTWFHWTCV